MKKVQHWFNFNQVSTGQAVTLGVYTMLSTLSFPDVTRVKFLRAITIPVVVQTNGTTVKNYLKYNTPDLLMNDPVAAAPRMVMNGFTGMMRLKARFPKTSITKVDTVGTGSLAYDSYVYPFFTISEIQLEFVSASIEIYSSIYWGDVNLTLLDSNNIEITIYSTYLVELEYM